MVQITADLTNCRYSVVHDVCVSVRFNVIPGTTTAPLGAPVVNYPVGSPYNRPSPTIGNSVDARSITAILGNGDAKPATTTPTAKAQIVPPGRCQSQGNMSAGRRPPGGVNHGLSNMLDGGRTSSFIIHPKQTVVIAWSDLTITPQKVAVLQQKRAVCNHFVGIEQLSRKLGLAAALSKYSYHFPKHYDFFPRSYTSYQDYKSAKDRGGAEFASSNKFWICKPSSGCMGRGVVLTARVTPASFFSVTDHAGSSPVGSRGGSSGSGVGGDGSGRVEMVVQDYIDRPFLISKRKCDLRCYVLVTAFDPLEVFFYEEGLVRICRTPYEPPTLENKGTATIHFANYAINKKKASPAPASATSTMTSVTSHPSLQGSASLLASDGGASSSCGVSDDNGSISGDLAEVDLTTPREQHATPQAEKAAVLDDGGDDATSMDDDSIGIKQSFAFLNRMLTEQLRRHTANGNASVFSSSSSSPSVYEQVDAVWHQIHLAVIKTLIAGQDAVVRALPFNPNRVAVGGPSVRNSVSGAPSRAYSTTARDVGACRTCFEVLGFDILLDQDLKPWVIEVNHSPSWATETELDLDLKRRVIEDTFRVISHTHDLHKRGPSTSGGTRGKLRQRRGLPSKADDAEGGVLSYTSPSRNNGYVQIFPTKKIEEELGDLLQAQQEVIDVVRGR